MTLPIAADKPLVKSVNCVYARQLLEFNGFEIAETVGVLHKVKGFDSYNHLLDINSVFSSAPRFDLVDRTQMAVGPVVFSPVRPWSVPRQQLDLRVALEKRVADICALGQPINIFWSGGVDSTTIVTAFLRYAPDIKQCRIVYSPWSTYEHPDFYELLKTVGGLELIDISGEFYLNFNLDGVFVSGNSGDEMHASLDKSFFELHGYDFLFSNWKDFFYSQNPNDDFMDFCQRHFSAAGRKIETVLDARWWFYTTAKLTGILYTNDLNFLTSGPELFDPARLIGFYDCDHYEQFIYFNTDRIVENSNYASWKQFLKDFCYEHDGFDSWRTNKEKFHSVQVSIYSRKKQILNNSRSLMLLDNGQRASTDLLPLFSINEWNRVKQQYQHVFRTPNTV